jgi:hypothetical protein
VKHFDKLSFLHDTEYHTIDVGFGTVEQMSKLVFPTRHRASVGMVFQAEDRFLETPIPFQGDVGMLGVDLPVHVVKVALSAGGDVNDVCHA